MTREPVPGALGNLEPRGVSLRRGIAAGALVAAVGWVLLLDVLDLPGWWWPAALVPMWVAALCWLQAAAKT